MRSIFWIGAAFFVWTFTPASASTQFSSSRVYEHHLFQTAQECREAQRDGMWFNCQQIVEFRADGTALVVLTDIANDATYKIKGNQIVLEAKGAGDMPSKMIFIMDHSERNLILRDSPLHIWELQQSCESNKQ